MERIKQIVKKIARILLRIFWVTFNNLYCIPIYVLAISLLTPVYLASPHTFYKIEETCFTWMLSMVSCWSYTAGYQIAESGDSLDACLKERILYMPNHQSTADVPFLMNIFTSRFGFSGRVMWLMDKVFKFTNFGVVSWIHDDFFIQAGKETREQSLTELRSHLQRVFAQKTRDCLVLFPEGGFLRKRKAVSQRFAKKKDLPLLEHCTIPRTGALDVIMDEIGPRGKMSKSSHISKIVDVTIAYPEGKPLDLQNIITGYRPPCVTHVHYRIFDAESVPTNSEELFKWMVKLYEEKEQMLDQFYRTGEFPYKMFTPQSSPPNVLKHCTYQYVLGHLIFILGNVLLLVAYYTLFK
jgi:lysophosphatidylglycerol acyltransferase 1